MESNAPKPARTRHRPFEPGEIVGRWTIVRPYVAGMRNGFSARRYYVRCVCGRQQPAFQQDLRHGRSSGCRSATCRHAWEKAQETKVAKAA